MGMHGLARLTSFNTQPPEGGCGSAGFVRLQVAGFNTQPPEGGCVHVRRLGYPEDAFQHTAARRRLRSAWASFSRRWGFNTQPPEGGCGRAVTIDFGCDVSTHSRPKAAAWAAPLAASPRQFQHTAARRRLPRRS